MLEFLFFNNYLYMQAHASCMRENLAQMKGPNSIGLSNYLIVLILCESSPSFNYDYGSSNSNSNTIDYRESGFSLINFVNVFLLRPNLISKLVFSPNFCLYFKFLGFRSALFSNY